MVSLGFWALLTIGSTGAAAWLFDRAGVRFRDEIEKLAFSAAAGLGLLAYGTFAAGSAGFLRRETLALMAVVLFAFSARNFAALASTISARAGTSLRAVSGFRLFLLIACAVAVFFAVAGALAPPVGQDELCYHLMQPKNYVREGRIYEVPYSTNSLWPYLMHMLFTLGLVLEGPALAKLFHVSAYLFCGLAAYAFARRGGAGRAALPAAAAYLLVPGTYVQAAFAYVDNGLACFSFLSLYALYVYATEKDRRWAVVAGVFAGLAASTKLIGLFLGPIALAVLVRELLRSNTDRREVVRGAVAFFAAFAVAGGVWYARAWILRGNPFFPFYSQFFGGNGWYDPTYVDSHGRGGILGVLFLLWDVTVHPAWFGGEQVGPLYLAFLPALFVLRPLPAHVKFCLGTGAVYAAIWLAIDPNVRFFFPALLLFAVPAGHAVARIADSFPRAGTAVVSAVFAVSAAFAPYHLQDEASLLFGGSRSAYLAKNDRSYAASRALNRHLRPGETLLSTGEVRGFHFDAPFTLEGDFYDFTHYGALVASPRDLAAYLRAKGFTHVLSSNLEPADVSKEPPMRLLRVLRDPKIAVEFFREELIVNSGDVRYVLYRIL